MESTIIASELSRAAMTAPPKKISDEREFNGSIGWIAGGSECEAVRAVVGVSARVILDAATLKELENDVETLANFLPAGGVLEFDLAELVLDDSVELGSPITIEGNGATVHCPNDQQKRAFKVPGLIFPVESPSANMMTWRTWGAAKSRFRLWNEL
ncbi:hypothetical protein BSKO_06951 [Bryopsis sp. KO-2023]|nr:hypothetical protein BSKO_06951 [Bryopsis sp. KO-2023]